MAQRAAVPAAADGPFLNPVTKNKLILHSVSIIGGGGGAGEEEGHSQSDLCSSRVQIIQ